ncbi:hypothetical protein [Rhodococcus sp. MEB064]|uniref:hypothetical protein n=1 Tax=Rhodococcus sp. MEB064 TaxID=1587522 RepID=UPI0005AC8196|nr:hypothetical protein [Rhodococcus sp. MEB064]KIQ15343.1 hypothetical protein RU01_15555 [Rhodococcus sp. MEB064]
MDANQIVAIGGVITGLGTIYVGYIATRSKVKVDDVVTVQAKLDRTNEALEAEQAARRKDRVDMEADHRLDRAQADAEHEDRERSMQRRIDMLSAQLDEALKALNKLDRILFHARTYIARLLRVFAERDETPPPRPEGLDE